MMAITGRHDMAMTVLAPPDLARHAQALAAAQEDRAMFAAGEAMMTS